jgi:hypothetical protein
MKEYMTDTLAHVLYEGLKFWLPVVTGFGIVIKAYVHAAKKVAETKNSVQAWADTMLNNHLHSIQDATMQTVSETKKTNALLKDSAQQAIAVADHVERVASTISSHQEKEAQVWAGVVKTLAIIEDRTAVVRRKSKKC